MSSLRPVNFKLANRKLYAPSEEGCCSKIPLPVWTDGTQCVSCWKCSFLDRLRILFTGRVGDDGLWRIHITGENPVSEHKIWRIRDKFIPDRCNMMRFYESRATRLGSREVIHDDEMWNMGGNEQCITLE